jgi:hypothetical protein
VGGTVALGATVTLGATAGVAEGVAAGAGVSGSTVGLGPVVGALTTSRLVVAAGTVLMIAVAGTWDRSGS